MSTIAANRSEIVADSQVTSDSGVIVGRSAKKIKRLGPGDSDLVACMGREDNCIAFEKWYADGQNPDEKPDLDEYFCALVLTAGRRLFKYFDCCTPVEVIEENVVIGAGDQLAMGAMAAGATPKEAVEIACRLNAYTGGPVLVKRLEGGG